MGIIEEGKGETGRGGERRGGERERRWVEERR